MKIPFFRKLPLSTHQVLEALSDGQFHSGLDLAMELNISRTAVWKIIQNIIKYQILIEVHRRKGYRLTQHKKNLNSSALDFLSESKISAHLSNLSPVIREELEIFIYDYSPLEHWAKRFFEHRRPLTDISICLLESHGEPPSPFGEGIHAAIGFSLSQPFISSSQFDTFIQHIVNAISKTLFLEHPSIQPYGYNAFRILFLSLETTDTLGTLDIHLQPNPHEHFLMVGQLKISTHIADRNLFLARLFENFFHALQRIREVTVKKHSEAFSPLLSPVLCPLL